MKRRIDIKKYLAVGLGVGAMTLGASVTSAAPVSLCAGATTVTMPDSTVVPMWGFALGGATAGVCNGTITVPGPELVSTALDPNLDVTLTNTLSVPVSLIITGQKLPANSAPVFTAGTGRDRRVVSLVHEAAPGGMAVYNWTGLNPGSHIYHSATHQQVQVQMGLYGAMMQDTDVNMAYTGVPYDTAINMFYSEIDPVLHDAVANGCYQGIGRVGGSCGITIPKMTSTWAYAPKYALVNGMPSDGSAPIAAGQAGQNILVRMFNAGLQTHMPEMLGLRMNLVAENGYTLPYPKSQVAVALHAMMTADVMLNTSTAGDYPLFDRRLNLSGGASNTGMMSRLEIAAAGGGGLGGAPTAVADPVGTNEDTPGVFAVTANDIADISVNVSNAIDPTSVAVTTAPVNGSVAVNAITGEITYTPDVNYNGADQFAYTVADTDGLTSSPALVSVSVASINDLPVAGNDAYSAEVGVQLTVAAPGVLANDNDDADGGPLNATNASTLNVGSVILNIDGSFTYTPGGAVIGDVATFTYDALDAGLGTTQATVSITITGIIPVAPTAANDPASTAEDNAVVIEVLTNDTAGPTAAIDPASISVTAPSHGTAVADVAGNVTYTPVANYNGPDSFTYTVSDVTAAPGTLTSNVATVSVTVTPVNDAPVGVADSYSIPTFAGVAVINAASGLLANDSDVENDTLTAGSLVLTGTGNRTGTVILYVDGSFAYTPAGNARNGDVDSFTYVTSDGAGFSAPTTVTINLVGAPVGENALPNAEGDTVLYSRAGGTNPPLVFPLSDLTANDDDPDGTIVSIQLVDGNNDTIADTQRTGSSITFDPVAMTLTYNPEPGTSVRPDRFWYQAIDDQGGISGEATVVVDISN